MESRNNKYKKSVGTEMAPRGGNAHCPKSHESLHALQSVGPENSSSLFIIPQARAVPTSCPGAGCPGRIYAASRRPGAIGAYLVDKWLEPVAAPWMRGDENNDWVWLLGLHRNRTTKDLEASRGYRPPADAARSPRSGTSASSFMPFCRLLRNVSALDW